MNTKVISLLKITSLVAALALGLASTAFAQWGWTEKDGRRVFSDQAPSIDVPDKSIFKRPGGAKAQAAAVGKAADPAAAASAPASGASAPKAGASAPKPSANNIKLKPVSGYFLKR